jgi:hypothetical protein
MKRFVLLTLVVLFRLTAAADTQPKPDCVTTEYRDANGTVLQLPAPFQGMAQSGYSVVLNPVVDGGTAGQAPPVALSSRLSDAVAKWNDNCPSGGPTTLEFQLTVSDGNTASIDTVVVTVTGSAPEPTNTSEPPPPVNETPGPNEGHEVVPPTREPIAPTSKGGTSVPAQPTTGPSQAPGEMPTATAPEPTITRMTSYAKWRTRNSALSAAGRCTAGWRARSKSCIPPT